MREKQIFKRPLVLRDASVQLQHFRSAKMNQATKCGWIVAALLAAPMTAAMAGDWPAFRGPYGTGISNEKNLPITWGPDENIEWKVELPGPGNSSPIVSAGRVFVSCATDEGRNRGLYCYDRIDGRRQWERSVHYDEIAPTHKQNPYSASTPVADGERVLVWHGTLGLYCYDFEGHEPLYWV